MRPPARSCARARTHVHARVRVPERACVLCVHARAREVATAGACVRTSACCSGWHCGVAPTRFRRCGPPQTCCALRAHASPGKARSRGHGAGATGRATAGQDPSPAAAIVARRRMLRALRCVSRVERCRRHVGAVLYDVCCMLHAAAHVVCLDAPARVPAQHIRRSARLYLNRAQRLREEPATRQRCLSATSAHAHARACRHRRVDGGTLCAHCSTLMRSGSRPDLDPRTSDDCPCNQTSRQSVGGPVPFDPAPRGIDHAPRWSQPDYHSRVLRKRAAPGYPTAPGGVRWRSGRSDGRRMCGAAHWGRNEQSAISVGQDCPGPVRPPAAVYVVLWNRSGLRGGGSAEQAKGREWCARTCLRACMWVCGGGGGGALILTPTSCLKEPSMVTFACVQRTANPHRPHTPATHGTGGLHADRCVLCVHVPQRPWLRVHASEQCAA